MSSPGAAAPADAPTLIGVRHHSPACARLVAATIDELRPAFVLIEGPVDMNDRLDEVLLEHELPVAIFTSLRTPGRTHASWSPLCAYSPEWVALQRGHAVGADVRFIDLPAWHDAFADRRNRYADAEQRYDRVIEQLSETFGVDNVDALWDHLFEGAPADELADRLHVYFDLLREASAAGEDDDERERYMARWVRAALARAGGRPVVVVTGGFHRPALRRLVASDDPDDNGDADDPDDLDRRGPRAWPEVPAVPEGGDGASYLVPFSFKRLDAFDGYQSGMPSPGYYQRVWDDGLDRAAGGLVSDVVERLRARRQPVSTADLIAAQGMSRGLAQLRGHPSLLRTDVLDGLLAALVADALEVPAPWTTRGPIRSGAHPIVVEMVAALSGRRVGRLHPDTPLPPLVHDVTTELERHALTDPGVVTFDLVAEQSVAKSRTLHRLRVLGIPGFVREAGPATGIDPVLEETWALAPSDLQLPALIEAGAYGRSLLEAAVARLEERAAQAGGAIDELAAVLFDVSLCGSADVAGRIIAEITAAIGTVGDAGPLGRVLAIALGLWRHDRVLDAAGTAALGAVIVAALDRLLFLVEGIQGGPAPADHARLGAMVAIRDAVQHAGPALGIDRGIVTGIADRLAVDRRRPPDLRGAAFGMAWSLGVVTQPARAVRAAAHPGVLGDWLAGLFALAREEIIAADDAPEPPLVDPDTAVAVPPDVDPTPLRELDHAISSMAEDDFLVALPSLRDAFGWFPPRERELIAQRVLRWRGRSAPPSVLLRLEVDASVIAAGRAVEAKVDDLLRREGLVP